MTVLFLILQCAFVTLTVCFICGMCSQWGNRLSHREILGCLSQKCTNNFTILFNFARPFSQFNIQRVYRIALYFYYENIHIYFRLLDGKVDERKEPHTQWLYNGWSTLNDTDICAQNSWPLLVLYSEIMLWSSVPFNPFSLHHLVLYSFISMCGRDLVPAIVQVDLWEEKRKPHKAWKTL